MDSQTIQGQIYIIKNVINDKVYIGQTVDKRRSRNKLIEFGYLKRFREHITYSKNKKTSLLGIAINTYGSENFNVELIEECSIDLLDNRERYWITQYNSLCPNGYNVLYGPPYSYDDESRKKISETMIEYFKIDGIRQYYSNIHRNHFKKINYSKIINIDIKSIKQNGENKIVYMYISYKININDENIIRYRRRYGGIHEDFEDVITRCYKDALILTDNNKELISFNSNRIDNYKKNENNINIAKIELSIQYMYKKPLILVLVSPKNDTKYKDKKRYVFGGKTISFENALKSSKEFIESIKNKDTIIIYKQSLIAATLSNCSGNP